MTVCYHFGSLCSGAAGGQCLLIRGDLSIMLLPQFGRQIVTGQQPLEHDRQVFFQVRGAADLVDVQHAFRIEHDEGVGAKGM